MSTENAPRPRGRPAGPSLAKEAVAILERNAFSALRGPTSRGAVPRSAFAEVDVSTVDRSVSRAFGGEKGRTPFDLASHQVSMLDGGTQDTLHAVFEAVADSFRATDQMETTLRVFLRANFTEACREEGLLASLIVQTAACAHLEANPTPTAQSALAHEVLDLRRQLYGEMAEGFAAGLAIALRRLRRRPKAPYATRDIVVSVMATSDGFILMHKLQPELIDAEQVVETQWGVIWSMTEPGLLDPPNQDNPAERDLVEAAIAAFAAGEVPTVAEVAACCGVRPEEADRLFPSIGALGQRCMDYAVGSSVETQAIAVGVQGAELSAVRDVLIATTKQAEATPVLIELIRKDRDSGFCAEARRHIAEALSQSKAVNLDMATSEGVAQMLVDAALQGNAGKPVWEVGLDAFAQRD